MIMAMKKPEKLDELLQQVSDLLPEDLRQTRQDIRKNLKAGLSSSLSRMDLVTREEFDVQSELLARSRVLLEELEHRVVELEERLKQEP